MSRPYFTLGTGVAFLTGAILNTFGVDASRSLEDLAIVGVLSVIMASLSVILARRLTQ